jgi:pimeloyl-ACP methyl ester carboxylesterase
MITSVSISDMQPPPLGHFVREAGSLLALRWKSMRAVAAPLETKRQGNGEPVMVIPGFLATDFSTKILRQTLRQAGYRAYGWGLGFNLGARADLLDRLDEQLAKRARKGKVTLIGWSLGGLYARELAKRHPDMVARVITLGSPFSGDVRANHAWRLYELINDHKVDSPPIEAQLHEKPPVPTIACWSRQDGIVAPACARGLPEECDRSIELNCTHMGFMSAPCSLNAVLDILGEDTDQA